MSARPDARLAAAEAALAREGFPGATVEVAGHEGEIAAVRLPLAGWNAAIGERGLAAAAAVRRTGFRIVAVDLEPLDG